MDRFEHGIVKDDVIQGMTQAFSERKELLVLPINSPTCDLMVTTEL